MRREAAWRRMDAGRMVLSQRFGARPMTSMRTTSGVRMASSPKRRSAAGLDVGERAFRSVEEALHQREHVGRAENDAERGGDGPAAADPVKVVERMMNSPMKPLEHGQADHGERGDDEDRWLCGQFCGESAVGVDLAGGVANFERAEEQEERAIDDAVGEDLIDGAGPAE